MTVISYDPKITAEQMQKLRQARRVECNGALACACGSCCPNCAGQAHTVLGRNPDGRVFRCVDCGNPRQHDHRPRDRRGRVRHARRGHGTAGASGGPVSPSCHWCGAELEQQHQIIARFCDETCVRANNRAAMARPTPSQARETGTDAMVAA